MQADGNNLFFNSLNVASGSNGTVAAHNSSIINLGVGGTILQKTVSGDASAGVMLIRPFRGNDPLQIECIITTTFLASGGASTVQFQLVTSSDPALASGNTIIWDSTAIAKATLVAGFRPFQPQFGATSLGAFAVLKQYLGIIYTIATNPITTGVIFGGFVANLQTAPEYQN